MYCKNCGQNNPDWSNYCIHDGTPLKNSSTNQSIKLTPSDGNYCSNCGQNTSVGDNYCSVCGHYLLKLTKVEDEQRVPVQGKQGISSKTKSISWSPRLIIPVLKRTFAPAIIAFVFMLVLNFIFFNFFHAMNEELFEMAFNKTSEDIAYEISKEFDVNVKAPDEVIGFTDFVMLSHQMSPKYELEGMSNIYEEVEKATGKLDLNGESILFILLPLIALFAAGIIYRRKSPEISIQSFLISAVGIGLLYSLMVTILSFFSGFDYKLNLSEAGDSVSIKIDTTYNFFFIFIKSLLIGTGFSLLGMLFSIDYRRITKHLESLMPFGDAIHQGFSAFVRGFALVSVIMIVILAIKVKDLQKSLEWLGNPFVNQLFEQSGMTVVFAGVGLSSLIYSMLHFSPLSFNFTQYGFNGETAGISYSIFSGFKYHGSANELDIAQLDYYISAYDIDLYLKLAIIIPILFLLIAGYFLKSPNRSIYSSLAIFSLVYSLFTVILASMGSIAIEGEMRVLGEQTERLSITLAINLFKVFMGSFIMSYTAGFAGNYLRRLLHKPVK